MSHSFTALLILSDTISSALAKQFADGRGSKGQGIGFVVVLYVYNFFFSACIGPLSWI